MSKSATIPELEKRRAALAAQIEQEERKRDKPVEELQRIDSELARARRERVPKLDAEDEKLAEISWGRCRDLQTKILSRMEGLDAEIVVLDSARTDWIEAKLRIASRHGPTSGNGRFHLSNEATFGRIGGQLPQGVSEASLVRLRSLLGFAIASMHAFPDVELKVTPKKGIPDPKIHRRTETLDDGTIRVL